MSNLIDKANLAWQTHNRSNWAKKKKNAKRGVNLLHAPKWSQSPPIMGIPYIVKAKTLIYPYEIV